jgi:hypothetical protein
VSNNVPTSANQADSVLAEHAAEIRRLGKRVITDVIEIGERLTKCRRIAGHGNWLPWLDREFGWTEQTALNFMRVAELNKSKTVLDLDLPVKALYLLAAPSTPEPAKTEIIERAKAGEALRVIEVKRVVERHKPPSSKPPKAKRAKATDPPPPPSNEVLQQRAAAAERTRALMGRPKPARGDIGADSGGEIKRLRERNEELENENACLRRENLALRTEIDELKARLAAVPPPDDGFDIPEFLRRSAS